MVEKAAYVLGCLMNANSMVLFGEEQAQNNLECFGLGYLMILAYTI